MKRLIRLICLIAITIGLSGCAIFTADGSIYTRTVYDPYPVYRYRVYSPPPSHHHHHTPPPPKHHYKPGHPPHHKDHHYGKPSKPAPKPHRSSTPARRPSNGSSRTTTHRR